MALDDTVTTTIVIDGSPTSRWDPGEAFVAMAVGPHDDVELIDVDSARMRSTVEVIDSGSIGPESIGLPVNPMGEDVPSPVPMRLPEPTDPRPDPRQEKCRRSWEAHRADLPAAVRDALAQKMYPLAVGLAIHGGTRDARALTDMVFLNEYGPRRGYCALTSTEQMYVMLWRDILATVVLPRLALPSPPLAQAGGIVCVGRNERRLVAPAPDDPRVDVTGRYEQHTGGAVPAYTFRINQAGTHVEAALTSVILPMGAVRERVVYRFHGDVQSDGSFLLFNRTKPDWRVTLRRDPQTGSVSLDSAGTVDGLDLVTATSTLMESTLDHLPTGSTLVRRQEWFPLTRVQVRHLAEQLSPAIIEPYLRAYFDTPAGDLTYQMAAMRKAARPLDDHLNAVFNDAHSGVHYVDRPLGTLYARTLLSEGRWKHVLTRSHLDWIQILLDSATQGGHQDEFQGIQTHLGLRPTTRSSVSTPQHVYRVTLRLTGGGLFLSGYTGTIAIEKTSAPAWPTSAAWPNGRATFGIRLGGLDSKAAIGVGSEIVGTATSAWAWQPPDFPGTVSMVRGGVGAAGLSAEAGFLHINGSGVYPPMAVLFSDSGFDPAEPPTSRSDLVPIPDLGGFWGTIQGSSFPDIDYTAVQLDKTTSISAAAAEDVHFCLDSAVLTADARQALRIMCATELTALGSPASRLTVIGHTDRSDTEQRNQELSMMRAQNTLRAVKDVLGDALRIPTSHVVVQGRGEAEAIRDQRHDGERNATYRRVDVIIDGRLVLVLRAQ